MYRLEAEDLSLEKMFAAVASDKGIGSKPAQEWLSGFRSTERCACMKLFAR